jgi:GAF domain
MKQHAFAWRTFLAEIIRDPQEKQRLADAMSVNPITLTRWASAPSHMDKRENGVKPGKSPRPQLHSLRKLVAALPEYRDTLLPSILEEFRELAEEDFLSPPLQSAPEDRPVLPGICYEQVLEAAATYSGVMRFTTVFDHLLDYALLQLDPERLGLWISVTQCTSPPPGHKVRSLRELFRVGTPPWKREPEERNFYLGAGSLTGYAVTTGRAYVIDNTNAYSGWPPMLLKADDAGSIAACPIQRTGQIAGCLFFGATQSKYFTKERMQLIQKYSCLAQVAFDDSSAYAQEDIELRLMPNFEKQKPVLRLFNKRVENILATGEMSNRLDAERVVARQIEDDFISISTREITVQKGPVI